MIMVHTHTIKATWQGTRVHFGNFSRNDRNRQAWRVYGPQSPKRILRTVRDSDTSRGVN